MVYGGRMACSVICTGTNRDSTAVSLHGPHDAVTSTCAAADKEKTTRSSATAARRPRPTPKGRRRPESAHGDPLQDVERSEPHAEHDEERQLDRDQQGRGREPRALDHRSNQG